MNVISKQTPKGLDFKIDELQLSLENGLKWDSQLDIYPKCYVLEHEYGKTIEHYKGKNEYGGNLIVSEKNKLFFTAEKTREQIDNIRFSTTISLFGILNLKEIKSNNDERCDEDVLSDVTQILCESGAGKIKIVTDFYEVFDVSYVKNSTRNFKADHDNIHPYFYFRIDFGIVYDPNQNC